MAAILLSAHVLAGAAMAEDTNDAVLASISQNRKMLDPQGVLAAYGSGGGTARFIVMLAEPANVKKGTALDSEAATAARRSEVAAVLDGFLNRKTAAALGEVTRRFEYMPAFAATLTAAQLQALLAEDAVVFVREDRMNTPHLRQGIPLMGALATRSQYTGAGVSVAVCDTGVDYMNPSLGGMPLASNTKVIGGYDFGEAKADPMDTDGHGTACAGIVAGTIGDNGDYIGGVAPDAKIYALKISGPSGSAADSAIIAAWEWCITHRNDNAANPIKIISISFGGGQYTTNCNADLPDYATAVANVTLAGIAIFASSGNDGYCDSIGSPACQSGIISVGAVYDASFGNFTPCVSPLSCVTGKIADAGCTSTGYYIIDPSAADKVAGYSNAASFLTLMAPSNQCNTLQCQAKGSWFNTSFGGTSAACPYAAGAAAALQSAAKARTGVFLTPAQIKSLLVGTGTLITDAKVAVTKPRVNLQAAISRMAGGGAVAPRNLLLQDE
jgi:subtilisin family serine protease